MTEAPGAFLRCPQCGTVFRAPGPIDWMPAVRCGRCGEAFDPGAHRVEAGPGPNLAARPRAAAAAAGAAHVPLPRRRGRPAQALPPSRRRVRRVPAVTGLLALVFAGVLVLVLVAQGSWLARGWLAARGIDLPLPGWPCVGAACASAGEAGGIVLSGASVISHAQFSDALVARAELRNVGTETIRLPRIELRFSGSDGGLVAGRAFTPVEYQPGRERRADLGAGERLQVHLRLLDPGPQAVHYQFRLLGAEPDAPPTTGG